MKQIKKSFLTTKCQTIDASQVVRTRTMFGKLTERGVKYRINQLYPTEVLIPNTVTHDSISIDMDNLINSLMEEQNND